MDKKSFIKNLLLIALPISIQSLFQASLSVIDQVMVGQLGEESISAIAFSGNYLGIFTYTIMAISGTASILIAQFIGKKDNNSVIKAFNLNLLVGAVIASIFLALGLTIPKLIVSFFTNDGFVQTLGSGYLQLVSLNIIGVLICSLLTSYLQNNKKAYLTMIAGLIAVVTNTLLNSLLIFGVGPFPELGVMGAGLATVITEYILVTLMLFFAIFTSKKSEFKLKLTLKGINKSFIRMNFIIALPMIFTEFMWSLGESVYSSIYGHMSNEAMAAMANIFPVISLSIGFFSGVAAAAGVMVGQALGERDGEKAYSYAKKLLLIEFIGSLIFGVVIILIAKPYANIYAVSAKSKAMTVSILYVYAIVLWTKVSNMVAGKIIQSGGKTFFNMLINLLGTWDCVYL